MTRSRTILLLVAALLIVAIALIVFMLKRGTPAPVDTTTPVTDTTAPTASPTQELRQESIKESGKGYEISVVYPVVQSTSITADFRTYAQGAVDQFKQDTAWAQDIESAESNSLTLTITYDHQTSALADNFIFHLDTYTGGAHGLQATKTYSYNPTGQLIAVADLFSNGADGLKTVAPYVQKELSTRQYTAPEWLADGAGPTETNYQNFTIDDAGVTFIFDPYQVAAYAAGTQKVTVPLSVFKTVANKDVFTN